MSQSASAPVRSEAVPAEVASAEAAAVQTAPARAGNSDAQAVTAAPAVARVGEARNDAVRHDAAQPIPYRSEADGMAASTGSALLVAVLLLAACAIALRFAKQRGLLDRWIVAAPGRAAGRPQMQVVHALRISPKTTLYRIRDADRHYLLVESLAQTTLTPLSDDIPTADDDEHNDGR
jgi:hypothetical protein